MSLALIQESAKEVRRLAIAGSPLAVGDFRLKKLIPPLEQAGAKVPVFGQVAKAIGDLVNGTEAESPTRLLSLHLLNAILYTQGQTGTEGNYSELEALATKCSTTCTPARVLKPLIAALTNAGAGRLETIKSACARGAFNDLRLIEPAIQALGDNYPEMADLVAEEILPAYGPGIVPRLKAGFEIKGKKQDARRLKVMHQLDPAGTLELCKTVLEDGSADVKAAAITCLGKHEECLPLVMEQVKARNQLLRAAALEALAEHDRPEIVAIFGELIKGKALDILAKPFRAVRNKQLLQTLISEGKRVFDLLVKSDEEQIPRYAEILDCLEQRSEPEAQEFLLASFLAGDKLAKLKAPKNSYVAGADILVRLASLLYDAGSKPGLDAILARRETLPAVAFSFVVRSALRRWPAEKVFQEFSPLLTQTRGEGKDKNEVLQRFIGTAALDETSRFNFMALDEDETDDQPLKAVQWDPRWVDAGIKADQSTVVCSLAQPGHKAALAYLLKLGEAKKTSDAGLLIRALVRCQYPKVTDFFLNLLAKKFKSAKYVDYEIQFLLENAKYLPAADLPKLDAYAASLDEKFVDHYLEALAPLRSLKPTEPASPTSQTPAI